MYTSQTPAQLRRQSHITLDTPTPAPSSGHTSVLITSLKPARSRSSLSGDMRASRTTFKPFPPHAQPQATAGPHLRPLAHSLGRQLNIPEINTEDLNLDHLEIATDGTERKRRTLEDEIRRGMGELGQRSPSLSSESESAAGFGDADASDDQRRGGPGELEDESQSGSESLGDDFSLRIGMAGQRTMQGAGRDEPHDHHHGSSASQTDDEDDLDRDLTYVTVRGGEEAAPSPAPRPNNKAPAPAGPAAAAAAPSLPFSRPSFAKDLPRSFNFAAPPLPTRANAAVFNDENRSPGGPSPAFRRPTFPSLHPTTVPLSQRPYFTSSPLSPPTVRAPNNSRQPHASPSVADGSRMRLPDVTGITDGLRSPLKARGHYPVAPGAAASDEAVINGALNQLKDRLARLERENSLSAARVRELETRLQDEEHEASVRAPSVAREAGADWQTKLREEQDRRQGLEDLVTRLRSQVAHLAHSLKSQAESINDLRAHRPATPLVPTRDLEDEVAALRSGLEGLGAEVEAVRSVVDELVREREAHAAAEWDKEEDERRRSMERSREPELEGLARRDHDRVRRSPAPPVEDPDRTPRANRTYGIDKRTGPGTPQTEASFHSREEIEALRQSILEEAARTSSPLPQQQRRPAPQDERREKRHTHFEAPPRPSTAPLPTRRPAPPTAPRLHDSYESHFTTHLPRHSTAVRPKDPYYPAPASLDHHGQTPDDQTSDDRQSALDARAERAFESVRTANTTADLCTICRKRRRSGVPERAFGSAPPKMQRAPPPPGPVGAERSETEYEADEEGNAWEAQPAFVPQQKSRKDRQATANRALKILEDDFEVHRRIFVELSNEYRGMSSRADGGKRKALSDHLIESINTLELKAEQIRDMHDLVHPAVIAPTPQRPTKQFGAGRRREGVV